ncbi:hypothetical protein [Streptomyces sp. NPDC017940]|uniref:hypothetical protein n=1 Tax=Streptomyces sp. NPDC017940 TaxID=3365017 RepID=UPI0037A05E45
MVDVSVDPSLRRATRLRRTGEAVPAQAGFAGFSDVPYTSAWWRLLAAAVSGLMALWGPLILALTYGYHRRRCRVSA